jgi:hypothetical protein
MTIKLALLKSGEDVIADMEEMVANDQVVGYFLKYPCIAKLVGNEPLGGGSTKEPFKLRLTPWMPLSKDTTIPVVADWVISIMEPIDDLKETYENGINEYKEREGIVSDDESDSDQSD